MTATAGQQSATVSWTAPATGGPADVLHGHAVPRRDGAAGQDDRRTPPATSTTVTGLTAGTVVHVHGAGEQPERVPGPRRAASSPVVPLGATAPGGADGRDAREADTKSAIVHWTAPAERRREPDHRLHGHAVHRRDAQTAPRTPPRPPVRVDRADRTARPTRSGSRRPTRPGTSPASAAIGRGHAAELVVRITAAPPVIDAGDGGARSTSASSSPPTSPARSPACASTRRRRTPAPTSGPCGPTGGTQLRQATFAGETASGWQTVKFATPVTVTAGTIYVASYLAPNGHYSVTRGGLRRRADRQRAAARARERGERQRRLRLRRDAPRSRPAAGTRPTTGSTCCSRPGSERAADCWRWCSRGWPAAARSAPAARSSRQPHRTRLHAAGRRAASRPRRPPGYQKLVERQARSTAGALHPLQPGHPLAGAQRSSACASARRSRRGRGRRASTAVPRRS